MTANLEDHARFDVLDLRLKTILPEEYRETYDEVEPVSMGSASLKYGRDGKVVWKEIWNTFCDLAMAGGPPHKGMLLEPGTRAEIEAKPDRYRAAAEEVCRGIRLTTDLPASPSPTLGWVQVECESVVDAEWLLRAIVMENISARAGGNLLYLPAGPAYRVEKEIKNVITAISKTCHYWFEHMLDSEQKEIGDLFKSMEKESPLLQPALTSDGERSETAQAHCSKVSDEIRRVTQLPPSGHQYSGWLGVTCPTVASAIWLMRALVTLNVLSRREDTVLFLPIDPESDPAGDRAVRALTTVLSFAAARGIAIGS